MPGVHLTRIYTRTGDDGTSGLGDFSRVPKTHPRLVAYADTDETNSIIGVALAMGGLDDSLADDVRTVLTQVQNDLFDVGSDLCVPVTPETEGRARITQSYIDRLEAACDEFNERLKPLDSFILPGGSVAAAHLHVARTVARRAERSTWALLEVEPETTHALPATYLNRLSDLLFILARLANDGGAADVKWRPGANA
ncbi:MAG TPA: cob(I)yrinic acid a,c-diamide adenosyltransferase [Mycobacteriales bacterium]|nr:cob(I)yrinic acid a,c-diamide adenosyltransferase [Mycobacteriales bacterium]